MNEVQGGRLRAWSPGGWARGCQRLLREAYELDFASEAEYCALKPERAFRRFALAGF